MELLCENGAMNTVIDHFGTKIRTEQVDEDHFRFEAEVSVSPVFFAWVFEFGGMIEIVGPQEVKDAYTERLRKQLKAVLIPYINRSGHPAVGVVVGGLGRNKIGRRNQLAHRHVGLRAAGGRRIGDSRRRCRCGCGRLGLGGGGNRRSFAAAVNDDHDQGCEQRQNQQKRQHDHNAVANAPAVAAAFSRRRTAVIGRSAVSRHAATSAVRLTAAVFAAVQTFVKII